MTSSKNHDETAAKKLLLEQAAAYDDELTAAGGNAPYGKGFQQCEAFAVLGGDQWKLYWKCAK